MTVVLRLWDYDTHYDILQVLILPNCLPFYLDLADLNNATAPVNFTAILDVAWPIVLMQGEEDGVGDAKLGLTFLVAERKPSPVN